MITRPGEYGHTNGDLAFTDSDAVRGGPRRVNNRTELYALASKADQLKEGVTVVSIHSDSLNGGIFTRVLLVDDASIGRATGWELISAPVAPGGAVRTPVDFTNVQSVIIECFNPFPPVTQVFDDSGYLIGCDVKYLAASQELEFTFSEPQTGIIVF